MMTVVLLVEKDANLRDHCAEALREDGYEVIPVSDYPDALEKNLVHHPDVVVLDPGADRRGLDAAAELSRSNKDLYVVLHTPSPMQVGTDFSAWVADALAPKSEDPTDLRTVLRRWLRLPRRSREGRGGGSARGAGHA